MNTFFSAIGERRVCFFAGESQFEMLEHDDQSKNEIDTLEAELQDILESDRANGLAHMGDIQDLYDEIDSVQGGLWNDLQPYLPQDPHPIWGPTDRFQPRILQDLGRLLHRYGVIGGTQGDLQKLLAGIGGSKEEEAEDEFGEEQETTDRTTHDDSDPINPDIHAADFEPKKMSPARRAEWKKALETRLAEKKTVEEEKRKAVRAAKEKFGDNSKEHNAAMDELEPIVRTRVELEIKLNKLNAAA
jgi:hypothetical protein